MAAAAIGLGNPGHEAITGAESEVGRIFLAQERIGQAVAAWARSALVIPPGHKLAGQPFELAPYFETAFDAAFETGVIEAGICLPRGNAKTSSCAALLLYFLVGPGYRAGWRGAVTATNGTIAGKVRDIVMDVASASGLPCESRFQPQPGRIIASNGGNAEIQFVNASKSAHLGASYDLVIADEYGEFEPEKARRTVDMAASSLAKRGGVMIGTGVQAWSPLFQEMKSRADRDTTVWHEYTGYPDLEVDDLDNLRRANPAIDAGIIQADDLLAAARKVKGIPVSEASFRAYHLNLPAQPAKDMLISLADFERNVLTDDLPPRGGLCSLGVDIGYSESQTAAAAYWSQTGRLEVYGASPSQPDLRARGLADGVGDLYVTSHERGELELHTGRVTDVGYFISMLARRLAGQNVFMTCDDYRQGEVLGAMESLGLRWALDVRRVGRGRDGQRDIIDSQKLLMSGRVKTTKNLWLMNAIRFATLRFASSNNFCELVKYKSNSRIDAAQALVLALGHGARQLEAPAPVRMPFFVA